MTTTIKALSRGSFAITSTGLYTVPSSTTAIITNISVCNTTSNQQTFNILFDGVELFDGTVIAADTTAVIDLKQALAATKIIAGYASDIGVKYHITGAEIA